ncbi:MAG: hypothetical protein L0H24_07725 [Microlunatus sp.]|nr:hypothetical protein [Microlunatus sp.]
MPMVNRGSVVGHVVATVVATLVLWAVGLDLLHAFVLAAVVVALAALRLAPAVDPSQGWPRVSDQRSDAGVRREVARLSWTMQGYEARVQRHSVRRLHALAAARLDERGMDLDDPRDYLGCQSALGTTAYRVVTEVDERPRYAEFVAAVTAVENLRPTANPGAAAAVHREVGR